MCIYCMGKFLLSHIFQYEVQLQVTVREDYSRAEPDCTNGIYIYTGASATVRTLYELVLL